MVFVGDEVIVKANFRAARARLAQLAQGDWLTRASARAYSDGLAASIGVWPPGDLLAAAKLAGVRFRETSPGAGRAVSAIRWEATGPSGGLFPVLDADITLAAAAGRATLLTLVGVYRLPPGGLGAALDRAVIDRVATATVQSLLSQAADAIADSGHGATAVQHPRGVPGPADGREPDASACPAPAGSAG